VGTMDTELAPPGTSSMTSREVEAAAVFCDPNSFGRL